MRSQAVRFHIASRAICSLFDACPITAAVTALAAGKITPEEMPIATDQGQRIDKIRVAPGFEVAKLAAGSELPPGAYTMIGIAEFLGELIDSGRESEDFRGTFNALELLASDNGLEEKDVAGLEVWKIDQVVKVARALREATRKEAERATELATKKRQEAEREAEALKESRAAAEVARKALDRPASGRVTIYCGRPGAVDCRQSTASHSGAVPARPGTASCILPAGQKIVDYFGS